MVITKALKKVNETGNIGRKMGEFLRCEGLIEFCGPRAGVNEFNCYKLTANGVVALMEASVNV